MKKEFKNWLKEVEKSNKAFELMTKSEKRVQIAKDVISRLEFKNLSADTGSLIKTTTKSIVKESGKESLKDFVNTGTTCEVCAKGGLFMSYIGRVNKFKSSDITKSRHSHEHNSAEMIKLQEIFSDIQLVLIETVFEGRLVLTDRFISERNRQRAEKMYRKYENSNSRLVAICENIIRNKGTFKL